MIRSARHEDYPAVESLWLELNALHAQLQGDLIRPVDTYLNERDFARLLEDPLQDILVLENPGIVGAAWVAQRRHSGGQAIDMDVAFIQEICVSAARRGEGLGRTLMAAVEDWARTRSLERVEFNVWSANLGAIGFYERLGYTFTRHEMSKTLG